MGCLGAYVVNLKPGVQNEKGGIATGTVRSVELKIRQTVAKTTATAVALSVSVEFPVSSR